VSEKTVGELLSGLARTNSKLDSWASA